MKVTNSKKAKKQTELQKLLEKHKGEFSRLENGKIKCLTSGHQFMPSEKNVVAHLNSKSYKKASQAKYDITEYENVLLTHKQDENFLFCKLTTAKVPKKKTAIQKHVTGKRFKSRFEQYKAQLEAEEEEQELIEEEGDEDEEEVEDQEEGEDEDQEQDEEEEIEEENKEEVESEEEEQKEQEQVPALIPATKNNSHSKNSTENGIKKPRFKKSALSGAPDKKKQKNQKKQKKQNKQKRIHKSRR